MESPRLERFWEIPCHRRLLGRYSDAGLYVKRLYRIRQTRRAAFVQLRIAPSRKGGAMHRCADDDRLDCWFALS